MYDVQSRENVSYRYSPVYRQVTVHTSDPEWGISWTRSSLMERSSVQRTT